MRHFVGHHAGQFVAGQDAADAGSDGDGGVLRVAAGGESVGRQIVNFVHFGHRHIGQMGLFRYQPIQLRVVVLGDGPRVGHTQGDAVAEPVGAEVHHQRKQQRNDDAGLPAQGAADGQQQPGQQHQQEKGFDGVHCASLANGIRKGVLLLL